MPGVNSPYLLQLLHSVCCAAQAHIAVFRLPCAGKHLLLNAWAKIKCVSAELGEQLKYLSSNTGMGWRCHHLKTSVP